MKALDTHGQRWLRINMILLIAFILAFLLRITIINDYGLSEDEVRKALAAQSYSRLDFSENAAHPALSKLLITLSVMILGENEFALRFPNVVISALTVYPIFLLGRKLYNEEIGLLASFFWAVNVPAISFATTAKEDTLAAFFWIFAIYYFVLAQEKPQYLRHSGVFVGLAAASKYTTVLLAALLLILFFLSKWKNSGFSSVSIKESMLLFIPPLALTFLVANFPILLPATIHNLWDHYSPKSPEQTGWIMMGDLLYQRPPYFLLLHILVKTPVLFLMILSLGIIFAIKDRSDSDKILLIWIAFIIGFFSITTYGYVRYYLVVIPAFALLAAQGTYRTSWWILSQSKRINYNYRNKISWIAAIMLALGVCLQSLVVGLEISPYHRMYVNELGGGSDKAGYYFPQDSVYDYLLREAVLYLNEEADISSIIAMNSPIIGEYYGRSDFHFIPIRDLPTNIDQWDDYNVSYAIVQDSRIFFENQDQILNLRQNRTPEKTFFAFDTAVAEVYHL